MLPADLIEAASHVEFLFEDNNHKACKVSASEWNRLSPPVRALIPAWLIELLATHALVGGGWLKNPTACDESSLLFGFWSPEAFEQFPWNKEYYRGDFLDQGYFPFGNEEQGDYWLFKPSEGIGGPIYLFSHSGLDVTPIAKDMATFLKSLTCLDDGSKGTRLHHSNFTQIEIPAMLTAPQKTGFLGMVFEPAIHKKMEEAWNATAQSLSKKSYIPPAGLSIRAFWFEKKSWFSTAKFCCISIVFPKPRDGELHSGLIIAGLAKDWNPETRAQVPVQYFVLKKMGLAPLHFQIYQWNENVKQQLPQFSLAYPIAPCDPDDFVEKVLTRLFGKKRPQDWVAGGKRSK